MFFRHLLWMIPQGENQTYPQILKIIVIKINARHRTEESCKMYNDVLV